jgi:protein-S-isoprenylcysteine O-methyltransferase Ste14
MLRLLTFAAISLLLAAISWKSLRAPRSHGFPRFFAWEAILALVMINVPVWFEDPFAWHQLIAWALLFTCIVPLFYGIRSLRAMGKPSRERRNEASLLAFEKTTSLVTTSIYQYIRHPLYSSLLLLGWGVFFKSPSWAGAALASAATICLFATAKADESECIGFFGDAYRIYMQRTKMFIPYIV